MDKQQHEENLALIRKGQGVTLGANYFTKVKDYCDFYDLEIPEQDREPEPEEVEHPEPELTGFERWNLQQHVQVGEDGQVRSVFIGPWGDDDRTDDDTTPEILAATEAEWQEIAKPLTDDNTRLKSENETLKGDVTKLRGQLTEAKSAVTDAKAALKKAKPGLPENAKTLLMALPDMTDARADEIIGALGPKAETAE